MTTKTFVPRSVKRLFLDFETSPNIVTSWRVGHKIDLSYDNIIKERAIICACWKWEGEKIVHSATWDQKQNDKAPLATLMDAINEADEVIGHNVARFDLPWFKTRCLYHDLLTLPEYKVVDTLQIARRKFYFNSNRLDYIAKYLGLGQKIKTGAALWRSVVLDNDPAALKKMVIYCRNDVILSEKVWKLLTAVTPHATHAGILAGGEKWSCPHCASTNVKVNKTKVMAGGGVKHGMQCNDCGRYYTIGAPACAAYLKAKNIKVTA
jgi:hypothetical protein